MKQFADVESYIAAAPKQAQKHLKLLRKLIKQAAPKAEESISYGIPAYKYFGPLVYFGGYQKHIGFYPAGPHIDSLAKELTPFKRSKGTIQFPIEKPLPIALIKKILELRVAQNLAKKRA